MRLRRELELGAVAGAGLARTLSLGVEGTSAPAGPGLIAALYLFGLADAAVAAAAAASPFPPKSSGSGDALDSRSTLRRLLGGASSALAPGSCASGRCLTMLRKRDGAGRATSCAGWYSVAEDVNVQQLEGRVDLCTAD